MRLKDWELVPSGVNLTLSIFFELSWQNKVENNYAEHKMLAVRPWLYQMITDLLIRFSSILFLLPICDELDWTEPVFMINPTWAIYVLHILQGHASGFHDLTNFLNFLKDLLYLILLWSQIFGPSSYGL